MKCSLTAGPERRSKKGCLALRRSTYVSCTRPVAPPPPFYPYNRFKFRALTRTYKSRQFRNQLNIWCDRTHIGYYIRFHTQSFLDQDNQTAYQSIPYFPRIINHGASYQAQGQSYPDAQNRSLLHISRDRLPVNTRSINFNVISSAPGLVLVQPRLITYGEEMLESYVVGLGTSKRKAEEDAARLLLTSGRHCFY
ncbi:hypothetical protein RSOLAG1IB_05751 [Rhizoctonia solani AG-1 IB]|uniref:Uncharacterized protein n=1 Tax=Thanatephorus cucumeris (strain AG1-IB / isolate 7/3/14) TaxID=1108050 RepID=A0A0B7F3B3_THACB|nr:hypothetical protein RSOLAG1IB_05751 [Rhizoctonia solani AG-1 IB]